MENIGIIEHSCSPYNSPIYPLMKPDGSIRLTLDLRKVNEKLEFFNYPMTRIDDTLGSFGESNYFSSIDFNNGFFQLKLQEADKDLFSFSVLGKRYRLTRLPQGSKNSAQFFQMRMSEIFRDLLYKNIIVFIDD